MTTTAERSAELGSTAAISARLLVTRRDPETTTYHPLGFLTFDGRTYVFRYLRKALVTDGFRPLPGLSDTARAHASERLFPIFAERVISARRPDRQISLDALGLGADAAPFEVLGRSGGRRVGDTIEVVPVPVVGHDGSLTVDFLVHGVRYQSRDAQDRITGLRPGEQLRVVHESDNESDPLALLVTDRDEVRLGYVPKPLLDVVHELSGRDATVLRANGPEVGVHFRLLARITGRTGQQPFDGPEWESVDDHM